MALVPFNPLDEQGNDLKKLRSCILIVGPPNSGKTASLETFLLNDEETMAYIQLPGEQGAGSLPALRLGERVKMFVESQERLDTVDWVKEVAGLKKLVIDLAGQVDVLALDGLHKGYDLFLAKATGGASMKSLDFEARLYEDARKDFLSFLQICFRGVMTGKFKRVVATCWDGREKDDPDDKSKTARTHLYPEFPGKLAKAIVGEFGVVLGAKVQGEGGAARYLWQTRPLGKIGGVGLKVPVDLAAKIPTEVPQDWRAFHALLT